MQGLLYSFLAGVSTTLGVIVLIIFGKPNNKVLSTLLGFAGGIMLAISVFELMPEAVEFGSMTTAIIGFLLGAGMMFILDKLVPHSHMSDSDELVTENEENLKSVDSPMLRVGYLVLFGIALHNLPEGLAIGAGLEASPELGLFIAVAIALHNIPEGLAIAGPLKAGGLSSGKIFLFTLIAGLMTPLGTAIGLIFFKISPVFVGGSLAFAAGAMIYIVNDELIPQANAMSSHWSNTGLIVGLLLGFALL
ncbi:ZIP family metal transporter [Serpentinicella sp. ANB-PHB4]|uniref:ZIP family metal transporter n=1 Tax=Serpentinicella sp. ANB-PHB4 TaxID=3074076 RepID=UPI002857BC08|nr:ZIP family metal transporter [Serpentinicella sp. ANB-PHB4]MDR5659636.1 ZIP family metal transporter [Serpentinicella sp. ANB-PHB4]